MYLLRHSSRKNSLTPAGRHASTHSRPKIWSTARSRNRAAKPVHFGTRFGSGQMAVASFGRDARLLALSTNPQAYARAENCGLRNFAWREVRTCRIGEAGTAPISTAKSRTDAVPHRVEHACRGSIPIIADRVHVRCCRRRRYWPAVSVRALPSSGFLSAATVAAARFTAHKAVWRYQASRRGRVNQAAQAGRCRARQNNVTHQGSRHIARARWRAQASHRQLPPAR
jgi:hypothetical protein